VRDGRRSPASPDSPRTVSLTLFPANKAYAWRAAGDKDAVDWKSFITRVGVKPWAGAILRVKWRTSPPMRGEGGKGGKEFVIAVFSTC
jgi:hypothetical protein